MKYLITGGAGYIGSHMVRLLIEKGHEVVVLDNLSTGNFFALQDCELLEIDLLDKEALQKSLKNKYFDGVIHFAAKSIVSESVRDPNLYFQTNIKGTLNLLDVMLKNNLSNIVFSSSAAIFGQPKSNQITEEHSKVPINPYGQSKLVIENILESFCMAYDFNATCLRYFNAAGAHESSDIGEAHSPETHLIPNIIRSCLDSTYDLKLFGNDYSTHDGTCVRDYIHVNDLASAHKLSLEYMVSNPGFSAFNLGNGNGFSILDIISACEKIMSKKLTYKFEPRRNGDPDILVADSTLAFKQLNWKPNNSSIENILQTALNWHKKYGARNE